MARFIEKHPDIKVEEIDVDQNPGLLQSFGISSIPTMILFNDDGSINKVMRGMIALDKLESECGL